MKITTVQQNPNQKSNTNFSVEVSKMVSYNERVEMNRTKKSEEEILLACTVWFHFVSFHIYYAISEALVLIANLMINKLKSKVQFGSSLIVAIASS